MYTFKIILFTLIIYSIIATLSFIISKENEDILILFGLGIVGITLVSIIDAISLIANYFKYHAGKRSIFECIETGEKYKCKVKEAKDISWLSEYKLIKRYATKADWKSLPNFGEDIIEKSKKNCCNCKYDKECVCDFPYNRIKCKHDEYGTVIEFDKFEKN